MKSTTAITWETALADPTRCRQPKPRTDGLTMVLDKGMGLTAFGDLLEIAAEYIDFIKLGFGTAGITPVPLLRKKLELARMRGVSLYPGGTFFEVAHVQNKVLPYLNTLRELGFDWIEISDGTVTLTPAERSRFIHAAREKGFHVITEIGKKKAGSVTPVNRLLETFGRDREDGACYVIVEGRESGKNIGIFNTEGEVDEAYVTRIRGQIQTDRLIWEAPQRSQQVRIMQLLGPKVNLGNIPPQEVLALESLRRGLRSDTFQFGLLTGDPEMDDDDRRFLSAEN